MSHQLNEYLEKLADHPAYQEAIFLEQFTHSLLNSIKEEAGLCILCENFLKNVKHFLEREKQIKQARQTLPHADLLAELISRIEKGTFPANDQLFKSLVYLASKVDGDVCFGDERQGWKGFNVADEYFHKRSRGEVAQPSQWPLF